MVRREFIKCDTCGCPITLRIAILSNEHPTYSFICPDCKMNIKVGLDIKKLPTDLTLSQENFMEIIQSSIKFKCIENCVEDNQNKTISDNENIINLMGDIPTLSEDFNSPDTFPMFSALKTFGTPKVISHDDKIVFTNWEILKSAWKLSLNNKETLSLQKRRQYLFFCYEDKDYDLDSEIFDFSLFFLGNNRYSLVENIFKENLEIIRKNKPSYLNFLKFCHQRFKKLEEKIIPLIDTYMKNYETFSSYLVLLKNNKYIDTSKYIISSFDFESIKKFYGDCFEVLADLYSIIAGLFNLLSDRDYDKFINMDMNKYLIIDKAYKSNCFKEDEKLKFLCEEYDSSIRNSSHHGGSRFDSENNILIIESGKPPKPKEMKIEEYVKHCVLIFEEIIETNMILVFYNHAYELENK